MATMLIWGGLQDYSLILNDATKDRHFKQFFRDLVADRRVHLICRSVRDMSAIAALAGLTEPYPRYVLGSDPLLLFQPPPTAALTTATDSQVGVILSVHAFAREMPCVHQFYAEAMAQGVEIIGIDGGTDASVPLTTMNGSYELCHFMQTKHYLITTRLHGALLAACLEIPVVAIALNEKFANVSNPDGISALFPVTDSFNHVLDKPEYIEQFRSHRGDRVKAKHLALAAIQYIKHVSRSNPLR